MNQEGSSPLSGRIAVVTGGSRGIGAAIARKLVNLGATTVITSRTRQPLEAMAAEIGREGGRCQPAECDVRDLRSVEALAEQVQRAFGRTDILVNNAGIGGPGGPLHQMAPENWNDVMNTNLRGVFYMVRAFASMMIAARRGDIVNISSLAGKNALPNGAAYSASKWGLNGLSYSMAEELRGYGIRVSVVCPGTVRTEFSPHGGKDPGKMLRAEDVAHVVAMIVTQAPQSFASEVLLRPTLKP